MRKKMLTVCLVAASLFCMTGCSEADRVSYNISKQADNFNVLRQLTVINNVTGDTIFTMTGKFSLYVDTEESQLEVTVENDDGTYSKHFVGLNDVTTYTVVDLDENYVDKYHFTINYNPNLWIPADIETID
jgi:outer membrane lipoprotein-sorting protein